MSSRVRARTVTDLFGVPPPPATGRERIIAAAIELFYERGFNAVGLDQIIDAAGVTKTTFYKHFEGKDDLLVAAVRRRDEWESGAWSRAVEKLAGDDPRKQILAVLDILDTWFNDPDFQGCMFINAAVEFPNPNDPVHQVAAAHKRRNREQWRALASEAGAGAEAATAFADCFTALVEGALILRQTHGRNDAARAVRPAAEHLMGVYIPSRRSPVAPGSGRPRAAAGRRAKAR